MVSKKHKKGYAQYQRECTNPHDQHREQLTFGCSVIVVFAPTLKSCRSDKYLKHRNMPCSNANRPERRQFDQVPAGPQ